VLTAVKSLRSLVFASAFFVLGCHAQTADPAAKLSPEMARRVEVLIRSKSNVPPNYSVEIGPRTKSAMPGFDAIAVSFMADGKASKPVTFLLSTDGKTLAQFNTFDISKDPKELVSSADRPARGGPASAPVVIVGFDDLECPFCAKMHAQIFPALVERYKNQVRIVYRDFPLDQHPWAMRAAIDTNCVGAHSQVGYWNMVDYIHAHAGDLGGTEKSIAKANETLDTLTLDEGKKQNLNAAEIKACVAKQDDAGVKTSMKDAAALGVDSTPALFINGEKIEGAVPLDDVYRMIDGALIAAGQTPPPSPAAQPAPAAKPGN
jgi:protein-disulfide isomerase